MTAVGVFCGSNADIDDRYLRQAQGIGEEAAHRSYSLVLGGGFVSCLGAVMNAAKNGGADVVAVVPAIVLAAGFPEGPHDELIVVNDIWEWKREIDRRSDAFVVLPGGLGTLAELFEVWSARMLGAHDKPIVVVDGNGVLAPLRDLVGHLVAHGFCRTQVLDAVHWTDSVVDAFDYLDAWLR